MIKRALNVYVLPVLLCAFAGSLTAQTTYYTRNAATLPRNWNEADSWTLSSDGSGSAAAIPGRTDNVVILTGHELILNNRDDNGSTAISANALGLTNVGSFNSSGTSNFYQTGNIYVQEGGTFTVNNRIMISGITTVAGTMTTSADLINLGRMEITATATFSVDDDFVLSGFSETLIYNVSGATDDLYLDHQDALLCGNNELDLGDVIDYWNGATLDQVCGELQITGCTGCPVNGSGSNTLSTNQLLIPAGTIWRYLDDGSDQGTAWSGTSFNDAGWSTGNAELGYGDGDETTTVGYGGDAGNKYTTTYFRKSFYVENPGDYSSLLLELNSDDGAVVYINGTEVHRENMPGGTIAYTTFASGTTGNENVFIEVEIPATDLAAGTNYIAVEIHQANLTSSDISFDLKLTGQFTDGLIAKGAAWNYLDDGSDQGTAWYAPGFDDSGWASGSAELGYGDGDESTTVSYGPDGNNKYVTTYFRHSFSVADPGDYYALELGMVRDDGAVVYLNGNEILRVNMASGAVAFNTLANATVGNADESTYFINQLPVDDLTAGTNVVAVEIHQAALNSSDISFDLYLAGIEKDNFLLPVELIYFEATPVQQGVLMEWATATETNNEYFTIEKSGDGEAYSVLTTIPGHGQSQSITRYTHVDPSSSGDLRYYRLSQTDFDGGTTILKTAAVHNNNRWLSSIAISPIPASKEFILNTPVAATVSIVYLTGKQILFTNIQGGEPLKVDTHSWIEGIYLVKLRTPGGEEIVKKVLVDH